ncbi:MAG: aminotransferase class III-fold pyridoxal phosphate-dependent enzyme [Acidobacteria bacterium]|nr:aminotransferase class III-fold pyridoxal phosphate-dependent enzyme [Acidobacteriota bacterium]
MVSVQFELPKFSEQDAARIAREFYGLQGALSPLPSERDQNFHLRTADNQEFVLKIANVAEQREILDLQNKALAHIAARAPSLLVPRVCMTLSGEDITTAIASNGAEHFVRLLHFLPGKIFAHVHPHSPELLRSLGRALGTLDRALETFSHPAADRPLKWDLRRAAWIREYVPRIADVHRRAIVERLLTQYDTEVTPALASLRSSIIYNDANDYNILVGEESPERRRITGVIDFGDMLYSNTVCELAVACAYAMLCKADPIAAAAHIVAGYHENFPLTERELEMLFPLIRTRLAVSVTNSNYQREVEPGNKYLMVTDADAWALLEKLEKVHPRFACYTFRHACGLPPCPGTARVVEWLKENANQIVSLVEPDLKSARIVTFDLSAGSREIANPEELADLAHFTRKLFTRIRAEHAAAGIGRYDEARLVYTSDLFQSASNDGPEWRSVHLGLDVFMEPGSPVFAPLDGTVHSFRNNAGELDYGPTIILQHSLPGGVTFYTLYGHMSADSLDNLREGLPVKQGACFGSIGDAGVNGGWPPHLHFQIITDLLGKHGDFPGVARPSERAIWLSLSPDPNLIAGLPHGETARAEWSAEQILAARKQRIGPNLSISYSKPLKIVRGWKQFLYDGDGRRYLDAVNNVPHVGHSHPRVGRAAQEQMAVLNTNTRYLHENIVRYAERLCATLPEPLRVCFFVNSGSEANELALRLARAHTGRKEIIVLEGAYHGNTTSLVEISPYKFDGPGGCGAPPHVFKAPLPDVYRGRYKAADPQAGEKYALHVAEIAGQIRKNGGRLGAFISESLPSSAGHIIPPAGFLKKAYEHVRAAGGVSIADEVQVGFGRTGTHFWAFEAQGAVPDIVTLGKPIGNGHPLGAVVTTREIAESFANGMEFFSTFGGNPVSCAVGMAVLDVLTEEKLQENALRVGARLQDGLKRLQQKHPLLGDVRGMGFFIGVELVRNRETLEPATEEANYIANRMKDCGILIGTEGPLHNVLKIRPPMVFSEADAEELLASLGRILEEDFLNR